MALSPLESILEFCEDSRHIAIPYSYYYYHYYKYNISFIHGGINYLRNCWCHNSSYILLHGQNNNETRDSMRPHFIASRSTPPTLSLSLSPSGVLNRCGWWIRMQAVDLSHYNVHRRNNTPTRARRIAAWVQKQGWGMFISSRTRGGMG